MVVMYIKPLVKRIILMEYYALRYIYGIILYFGLRFKCPCCGGHFRKFLTFGVKPRPNAQCPRYNSLERHRLIWLYLKNRTNFFSDNFKVLHFAPEYIFQKTFKSLPNLEYINVDLNSPLAMIKIDITNVPFKDNYFDVILCSHVLEHVMDDQLAMRELFRVLKPGGWAILQVPIDFKRDKTFEDPNIVSAEDRARIFGQKDHVRIYGRDYKDRLEKAGFTVKVDNYVRQLGTDVIKKYSLMKEQGIYFCIKPKIEKD